jgi:hypothetical protein
LIWITQSFNLVFATELATQLQLSPEAAKRGSAAIKLVAALITSVFVSRGPILAGSALDYAVGMFETAVGTRGETQITHFKNSKSHPYVFCTFSWVILTSFVWIPTCTWTSLRSLVRPRHKGRH